MIINKKVLIGIVVDLFFILLYMVLYGTNANISESVIIFFAVISYIFMISILLIIYNERKFNLCLIFIILTFLFYFGQYIELQITGEVENEALSITKSYNIDIINHFSVIILLYIHLIHIIMIIFSKKIKSNGVVYKEKISGQIINMISTLMYFFSYPFALYYQYTRYQYTKIWGYGNTLYEQFTNQSMLLKLGEFFSGYVISMFILLLIVNKGKKKFAILVSILPYCIFYMLSGSRLQIALLLIVIVLILHSWDKPISLKKFAIGFVFAVFFSYLLAVSSSIRNYIGLYNSVFDAISYAVKNTSLIDGIIHLFDEFGCQIVSIVCVFKNCPSRVSFNYGKLFLYGIEIIIPNLFGYKRFFYIDNTDEAFKYFLNKGNTGLGSSFISESYYCFGFLGIIYVLFLGYIITKVSIDMFSYSKEKNVIGAFVCYYLAYCLIFTVRGDTFNIASSVFQYAIIPIMIMYLIQGIFNKKKYRSR